MKLKNAKIRQVFLMDGLDMKCNPVKTKCQLVATTPRYVVLCEGIKVIASPDESIYTK